MIKQVLSALTLAVILPIYAGNQQVAECIPENWNGHWNSQIRECYANKVDQQVKSLTRVMEDEALNVIVSESKRRCTRESQEFGGEMEKLTYWDCLRVALEGEIEQNTESSPSNVTPSWISNKQEPQITVVFDISYNDQVNANAICESLESFELDEESTQEHELNCKHIPKEKLAQIPANQFCLLFKSERSQSDCNEAHLTAITAKIESFTNQMDDEKRDELLKLFEVTQNYAEQICSFEQELITSRPMWNATEVIAAGGICRIPIYQNMLRFIVNLD